MPSKQLGYHLVKVLLLQPDGLSLHTSGPGAGTVNLGLQQALYELATLRFHGAAVGFVHMRLMFAERRISPHLEDCAQQDLYTIDTVPDLPFPSTLIEKD